jgi:hypothetical protein
VKKVRQLQTTISNFKHKSLCKGRVQLELQLKKCLFFKNDSYLSSYLSKESVFSQNPETKTTTFPEKSSFLFGEWFNE